MEHAKIARIKEVLQSIDFKSLDNGVIQDNKFIFVVNNKVYRCRMPKNVEKRLAEKKVNESKIDLLQDQKVYTVKELKKILKEKQDIDIDFLEERIETLRKEMQAEYLDLATLDSSEKDRIRAKEQEIFKLEEKFIDLRIEIDTYLEPAFEKQLQKIHTDFLVFKCTEKQVKDDKWEPVWESYDDYLNEETGLDDEAVKAFVTLTSHIGE